MSTTPTAPAASTRGVVATLTLVLLACGDAESQSQPEPGARYELVWSDEFDGPAGQLPEAASWSFDVGGDGWGNDQLEYDTDRAENASLDGDGHLAITARRESYNGNDYTSARIQTRGKVEYQYGRVEARISLPEGQGIWPAFWMLGSNFLTAGWPQCGEIDIMEYRGQAPAILIGTLHGPGYSGVAGIGTETAVSGGLAGQFRVFAVEWEPGRIRWRVDDFAYHEVTPTDLPTGAPWVFDQPFFMILNLAVGGGFAGNPDATTVFPQTMLVDYVRVYQRVDR